MVASIKIDDINQEVKCLINNLNLFQNKKEKMDNKSFDNFK